MTKQMELTMSFACPNCGAKPGDRCTNDGMPTFISCHARKLKARGK